MEKLFYMQDSRGLTGNNVMFHRISGSGYGTNLDELEVQVEMNENLISDKIKGLEILENKIRSEIESMLGIKVSVKLVEPKTIARSEGKAKRVIDKREI